MRWKKATPIAQINRNWVKKKSRYEKLHKYAGSPDLLLSHGNTPSMIENSIEAKEARNKVIYD